YTAIHVLLKKRNITGPSPYIAATSGAMMYIVNQFTWLRIDHLTILFGYSLMPLILVLFMKYLDREETKYKTVFLISGLLALSSISYHYVLSNWIILTVYLVFDIVLSSIKKGFNVIKKLILRYILILVIFIGLAGYWIIPYMWESLTSGIATPPTYVLTYESILGLSKNTYPLDIFRFMGAWQDNMYYAPSYFLEFTWILSTFILPITAFFAIIFNRNNKYVIFLSLIYVMFFFLSLGARQILDGALYFWLVFDSPFSLFAWIFRDSQKFVGIVVGTSVLLASVTLHDVWNKKINVQHLKRSKIFYIILIASFISFHMFSTWYMLTGDYDERIIPVTPPQTVFSTVEWINTQPGDFKVSWFPCYYPDYIRADWNNGGNIGLFYEYSINKGSVGPYTPITRLYFKYLYSKCLLENRTSNLGKLLGFMNVKYIVFRNESSISSNDIAIRNLNAQKDLKLVKLIGFNYIYENLDNSGFNAALSKSVFLVKGGLDIFTTLSNLDFFNSSTTYLIFLDEDFYGNNLENLISLANGFILRDTDDYEELISMFFEKEHLVIPFEYTNHYKPKDMWSRAQIVDPYHGTWHDQLKQFGLENWDFDYNRGLVFTYSNSTPSLTLTKNIAEDGSYDLFIRTFKNEKGGSISLYLDENEYLINTNFSKNRFTWDKVATINLNKGDHEIVLKQISGFNAVNLLAIIPHDQVIAYNSTLMSIIEDKPILRILEGEDFLFSNATISTKYGGIACNGKVLELEENAEAYDYVNIVDAGNYMLSIRYASTNNVSIAFDTLSDEYVMPPSTSLQLQTLGNISLNVGQHKLIIKSNFSDIDLILLYHPQNGETIEEAFNASVQGLQLYRISSLNYEINEKIDSLHLILLTETYYGNWELLTGEYSRSPIPVNAIANGFLLENTDTIRITYKYQFWVYVGLIVTLSTYIFIAITLFIMKVKGYIIRKFNSFIKILKAAMIQ
ncbi:MAG: hypothetical protein ACTSPL_08035, partial [Candidatus Odinarchaeia archaeon]